ncbi:MAG: hypothetical protein M1117_02675 [Candidatus Thermoplasmatota archaeon]|nr:hypothetical protein [Candidatus Thermoplasmatota archaeon]
MKRYYSQTFDSEDLNRIPQGIVTQPSVYQLPRDDHEKKRMTSSGKPYSILSASKYILMISLMLYWLPLIGQMIGGFIGGRRAGSPLRAIIAALLPVMILFGLSSALHAGLIPIRFQNATILTYTLVRDALERLPVASPYVSFATTYVGSFIDELRTAASFKVGNYLITLAFAYVGGILSAQSRRELEYVSRYAAPTTNILVAGNAHHERPVTGAILSRPAGFIRSLISPGKSSGALGFENMRPVYPYTGQSAGSRHIQPVARPVTGYTGAWHPTVTPRAREMQRVIPARTPRSWEDMYGFPPASSANRTEQKREATGLARNEMAGAYGRQQYGGQYGGAPVVKLYRPEAEVSDLSFIRRNRIKDESTRKLVERALGKDYFANMGRRQRQTGVAESREIVRTTAQGKYAASATGNEKKDGEWELL